MAHRDVQLGKLTPPDTSGLLSRNKLFARLDLARKGNLAWITAPAGSGKTSLLASWIHSRDLPVIWHQLDAGDNDLASFFYYLSLGENNNLNLPAFAPEYLGAPDAFARRYFTQLFGSWTSPHVLVLDNYQELAEAADLHKVLDVALKLLPRDSLIAVASRNIAPPALASRYAYAGTSHIGWEDLRFEQNETTALAELWNIPADAANTLHKHCDGWVAMQILLMRLDIKALDLTNPLKNHSIQGYINSELFIKRTLEEQTFLVKAALPPFLTCELAVQLTGNVDAERILRTLSDEHLLTTRHDFTDPAKSSVYQFHPLFREFLIQRLAQYESADDLRLLRFRTATLLQQYGEIEAAAEILVDAQNWLALSELICKHAQHFIETGRMASLVQWIARLPTPIIEADPWLLFWQGTLLRFNDPGLAREKLKSAYSQFCQQEHAAGAYLTWATIIESFAAPWMEVADIPHWLDEMQTLRQRFIDFPTAEIEFRVTCAGLSALLGAPYHSFFRECVIKAESLSHHSLGPGQIGVIAWPLAIYAAWSGANGFERIKSMLAFMKLTETEAYANPLSYLLLCGANGYVEAVDLQPEKACKWIQQGLDFSQTSGVHLMDFTLNLIAGFAATINGDIVNGLKAVECCEQLVSTNWMDFLQAQYLRSGILLMQGNYAAALTGLNELPRLLRLSSAEDISGYTVLAVAQALVMSGQTEAARKQLAVPRDLARRFPSPITGLQADLVEAYSWFLEQETEKGQAALRKAFALGRELNAMSITPFWLPELLVPLCEHALEAGIEVDYVQRLIRRRGLLPKSSAIEAWPYPIRVYTLGRFAVLNDNKPLPFSVKAQKKPLDLLKAIIAMGSQKVASSALIDTLWPESAGDDARHSLEMNISRLRKLLGSDTALLVSHAKVSLNEKLVWVDAVAFEQLARSFDKSSSTDTDSIELGAKAITRYTGTFLAGEEDMPLILGVRERMRNRYLRVVASYGSLLEKNGDYQQAMHCYQRTLESEPVAEKIYQQLMHCLMMQGEYAQTLQVYTRCRQMLSIHLGVQPSAKTEAIAAHARRGDKSTYGVTHN
jgi:LuxR family maltose regulon positive regulatory protein